MFAHGPREPAIGGVKRRLEGLRQRHVQGIVRREVLTHLEDAVEKRQVREALERKVQVVK
jgi:hypothetical protein